MNVTSIASLFGFVIMLGAGTTTALAGGLSEPVNDRALAFGLWAIAATVILWISGAGARPRFHQPGPMILGADVTRIPVAPWVLVLSLLAVPVSVSLIGG
jgi:hypothetical protein